MKENELMMKDFESTYDVFISYRRISGRDRAHMLQLELKSRGYRCFFDYDSIRDGKFDERILTAIAHCGVFVFILTDGSLKECWMEDDWVRREILCALENHRKIVAIAPADQDRRIPDDIPPCLSGIANTQVSKLAIDDLFEKSVDKIVEDRFKGVPRSLTGGLGRAGEVGGSGGEVFSTIPVRNRNFVGRESELRQIEVLCGECRIPLIHGPGGCGKTELAYEYAHRYDANYPGGCFLVPMEMALSWKDAFRYMLDMPTPNGETVWKWLSRGTRWEEQTPVPDAIPGLLAAKARTAPLLLVLDNVERPDLLDSTGLAEGFPYGVPNGVHAIATIRHLNRGFDDTDAVRIVSLDSLGPDASVELMVKRCPPRSRQEQDAVVALAELLGCHAWSVELVASEVAQNRGRGVTYRTKLEALSRDSVLLGKGRTLRKTTESNALELLRPTMKSIRENEPLGEALTSLAQIASLFPANGVSVRVLSLLWKMLLPEAALEMPFRTAITILRDYSVFRPEEPLDKGLIILGRRQDVSMHRFTRGGLQTSLVDSREWMISRVCEALLDEKVFSNEDWISLSDDSPLFEGCPFDRFSEDDIVALLQRHPEHAHRFDVDGLANMKRAHLFAVRPELVGEHSLDGLGSGALWWILAAQPGLAERMRLKLITPEDWSFLLVRQPQLAELCDMRRFSPRDWSRLLQARPEFASVCDFAGFSEANWVDLIIEQPSFADRVDMEEFSCENLRQILWFQPQLGTPSMLCRLPDYDFERVLSKHLELVRLCDTAGFSAKRWAEILGSSENPKAGVVADLCGRVDMGGATAAEWHELLCTMHKKKGEVYQGWSPENLSIFMDWAIREVRGALVRYDNREKLMLATVFPELLAHCEYNLFDVEDWALALAVDPKLAGTCDFSRFGRIDWMTLLMLCPEFEDRCDFSLFISDDWAVLLAKDFRFAAHCDVSRLDGRFWTMYARAVQAIAASGEMWYGHPDLNVDGLVGALPELLTRYDFSKVDEYLLKLPDGDKWRDAGYRLGRGFGIFARQKRERYVFFDETEHEGSFVHPSSAEAIYDVTSQCLAGICPEIFDFTRLQNQWCIEAVAATLLRNPEGERLLERFDWSQVDASTRKAWHDAGVDVGG